MPGPLTPYPLCPGSLVVDLASGDLSVGVRPDLGAALVWFRGSDKSGQQCDWMRPAPSDCQSVLDTACFPLVPFSNRIAGARFEYGGRRVDLVANWPGGMAIHGIGWQQSWHIEDRADDRLSLGLALTHEQWPWEAAIGLDYILRPNGLSMTLRITNQSTSDMPCGLGFHPYFSRGLTTRCTIACQAFLPTGKDQLPIASAISGSVPETLLTGDLPGGGFDNCLVGWRGSACVDQGDAGQLRISTHPHTQFALLYVPEGEDFFCFEPVSHIPNAHNARDGRLGPHGLVDLGSGETMTFTANFECAEPGQSVRKP